MLPSACAPSLGAVPPLSNQNDCVSAASGVLVSTGIDDSGIVGDVSVGFVFVMLISCCMSMLQNAKIPMTSQSWGFRWSWDVGIRVGQRRYLSENATSRLRGRNNCLTTVGPALLARVLTERIGVFLLDHCQVGFAVMFIIGAVSFSTSE